MLFSFSGNSFNLFLNNSDFREFQSNLFFNCKFLLFLLYSTVPECHGSYEDNRKTALEIWLDLPPPLHLQIQGKYEARALMQTPARTGVN